MKQYSKPSITKIQIEDAATLMMWTSEEAQVMKEAFDVSGTVPAGRVACGGSTNTFALQGINTADDITLEGGLFPATTDLAFESVPAGTTLVTSVSFVAS